MTVTVRAPGPLRQGPRCRRNRPPAKMEVRSARRYNDARTVSVSVEAMSWVFKRSPYPAGAQLVVHLAIADVVNDANDNEFWMTTASLAEKARTSRSTVVATLKDLVDRELLEVLEAGGGRGRATRFRFLMPPDTPLWTSPETAQDPGSNGGEKLRDLGKETARSAAAIRTTQQPTQELKAARNPKAVENLRSSLREGTVR